MKSHPLPNQGSENPVFEFCFNTELRISIFMKSHPLPNQGSENPVFEFCFNTELRTSIFIKSHPLPNQGCENPVFEFCFNTELRTSIFSTPLTNIINTSTLQCLFCGRLHVLPENEALSPEASYLTSINNFRHF